MSSPAYHRPQSHPRAVRRKVRLPLADCHPRSIFRRVLSRLRETLKDRRTEGPEFSATARAICEVNDHRRRFHRDACAPPLEPHPRLAEARFERTAKAAA